MQGALRNGETGRGRIGIGCTVVKEEDIVKIMSYDVMTLPALVVDGRVVAQGRKLSLAEVRGLLTK